MPPRPARALSAATLEAALTREPPAPLYILAGGGKDSPIDPIALGVCVGLLRGAVLGDQEEGWNLTLLAGERVTLAEVLDAAGTFALGGGRRLVLVKGVGEIAVARDDAGQAEQIAALGALSSGRGAGANHAVILLVDPPLDERFKVHKAIAEAATIVTCASPSPAEMPRWLAAEARTIGVSLEKDAASLLIGIVGSDTLRARSELEKLRLYVGHGAPDGKGARPVDVDDVAALAAGGAIADTWKFADAVAALDEATALRLARDLVAAGEEPIGLIAALAFRVRQMIRAAEAYAAGTPVGALLHVAKLYGQTPTVIPGYVRGYDPRRIVDCIEVLYQADRLMKSGGDSRQALFSAVSRVVRLARRESDAVRPASGAGRAARYNSRP